MDVLICSDEEAEDKGEKFDVLQVYDLCLIFQDNYRYKYENDEFEDDEEIERYELIEKVIKKLTNFWSEFYGFDVTQLMERGQNEVSSDGE